MSWATRRKTLYISVILGVFLLLTSIPVAILLHKPETCFDGIQNQTETDIDKGGPCVLLDPRTLTPEAILWARSFLIRPNEHGGGTYSAVAYIENTNKQAGIRHVAYHFGFYDDKNIIVAERSGVGYVLPGTVTPIFEGGIDAGNRPITHTYFSFSEVPMWERVSNPAQVLRIDNIRLADAFSSPRLTADIENTSVKSVVKPSFVAILFSPNGNAFSASATAVDRLQPGEKRTIVFTWPSALTSIVGPIDVIPLLPPDLLP